MHFLQPKIEKIREKRNKMDSDNGSVKFWFQLRVFKVAPFHGHPWRSCIILQKKEKHFLH